MNAYSAINNNKKGDNDNSFNPGFGEDIAIPHVPYSIIKI